MAPLLQELQREAENLVGVENVNEEVTFSPSTHHSMFISSTHFVAYSHWYLSCDKS
jgi:hypothetical protein